MKSYLHTFAHSNTNQASAERPEDVKPLVGSAALAAVFCVDGHDGASERGDGGYFRAESALERIGYFGSFNFIDPTPTTPEEFSVTLLQDTPKCRTGANRSRPVGISLDGRRGPAVSDFLHSAETNSYSYLADRTWVEYDVGIGGQERHAFSVGLSDQQAVERVFMDGRQSLNGQSMFASDRQFSISVIQQAAPQEMRIDLKIGPLQSTLDNDLPYARHTEEEMVVGRLDRFARRGRKPLRSARSP